MDTLLIASPPQSQVIRERKQSGYKRMVKIKKMILRLFEKITKHCKHTNTS